MTSAVSFKSFAGATSFTESVTDLVVVRMKRTTQKNDNAKAKKGNKKNKVAATTKSVTDSVKQAAPAKDLKETAEVIAEAVQGVKAKSEAGKGEGAKTVEAKTAEAGKGEGAKTAEAKTAESKTAEAKTTEPKSEAGKGEGAKTAEAKTAEAKTTGAKSEAGKGDGAKTAEGKNEAGKGEGAKGKKDQGGEKIPEMNIFPERSSEKGEESFTLYVGHLMYGIEEADLKTLFGEKNVKSVRVVHRDNHVMAFVEFEDYVSFAKALKFNGTFFLGTKITCEWTARGGRDGEMRRKSIAKRNAAWREREKQYRALHNK
eukprot:TRINITY_DN261_c0_g1_i1.p1 TRINITY_DN261_c0_g1~~TRINITY_DN261_c0_g1_i1.p1  ORF type:complete len:315 (-),score=73.23 TRINITY_DN261_c0_g1_i1:26-970(-)